MNALQVIGTVTSHPWLISGGLLLLLWYLLSWLSTWYRLRHIPGPLLASVSNLWMIRASTSTRLALILEELGAEYGPLVRIGPNQVLTSDVNLLRRAGAVRSTYDRGRWHLAFRWQPRVDNTFTLRSRAVHDARKAKIATAYNTSGREVDLVEPSVDEQVQAMVALVRGRYARAPGTKLLDFAVLSSYLTLDVITRAAFGKELGHLEADADVTGFLADVRNAWPMVSLVNEWPLLREVFYSKWWLALFGPKVTDASGPGKIMSGVVQVVQDRFAGKTDTKGRNDMLGSWIQHGLSQAECEAEGLLALVAGSETTAAVLRVTLLCILCSPPVYQKLKNTVKNAVKTGAASDPVSFSQAKGLPYLAAVVMEGMRMRAGAIGAFPKIVPPQGETVQGVFIPGGTLIASNTPAILRDTHVFGPDAALFRPERWLEVDQAKKTEMFNSVEMMFGNGRWMCAGKPIAYMELYKTLFELFRSFDFHLANPTKPWDSRSYNAFVEENFWLRVTETEEAED